MNLGIYVSSMADETFTQAATEIRRGLDNRLITDASIFYDTVAPCKTEVPCGLFNSTDLWNFSGTLVTLSVEAAVMACKTVNKSNIIFGYGWGAKNTFAILNLVYKHNVKTICKTEELVEDFYRLTGQRAAGHTSDLNGLIEILNGDKHE